MTKKPVGPPSDLIWQQVKQNTPAKDHRRIITNEMVDINKDTGAWRKVTKDDTGSYAAANARNDSMAASKDARRQELMKRINELPNRGLAPQKKKVTKKKKK